MIYNDDFNNYKKYNLEKAKLILTDIPYNIELNRKFYGFEILEEYYNKCKELLK